MTHISKPQTADIVVLLFTALIWGTSMTAIKFVIDDLGVFWTAAFRVGIGFFVLLPFYIFRPGLPKSGGVWASIGLIAILNMVAPFILINWALQHIDAGVGALLLGTTPITAMILGHLVTADEHITPYKLLAVLCTITGIGVLAGPEAILGLQSSAFLAQFAILLSGIFYVSAGFVMRRIDMPLIPFTTHALGMGTLILVIMSLAFEGLPDRLPQGQDLFALAWLGILATGLGYMLRFFLVKRLGVSIFALAMNTVPVFGLITAALILDETMEMRTWIALALVLGGLVIVQSDRITNSTKPQQP